MAAARPHATWQRQGGPVPAAPFTALVLAGGLGTRLRGVLSDRPKPLADVGGAPFVRRVLQQLAAAGCEHAVVCTGHLGEQVPAALGARCGAMTITCSREPEPLGTAGALRHALPFVGEGAEGVLVVNGDTFCGLDLGGFVAAARAAATVAHLAAVQVGDARRYGRLDLHADGAVRAFREKDGSAAPGPIHSGICWLPRAVLEALPAGQPRSLERDVLPLLAAVGALRAFVVEAPFLDIGVPEDLARAESFFAALPGAAAAARRLLVADRDGTLIVERHYLADPAGVELLPGVVEGLRSFQQRGYEIVIVSNQSGVGRGFFTAAAMAEVNAEVLRQLAVHGIRVRSVHCCTHRPEERCACRKPEPQLLDAAIDEVGCAPSQCLVVGDKSCDVELGRRRGARTALVRTGYGRDTELEGECEPDVVVDDLEQLAAVEANR